MKLKLFIIIIAVIISVLAWGYWHARTHGAIDIAIYDVSEGQTFNRVKDVHIQLNDSAGTLLALGESNPRHGVINLDHPEYGSCKESETDALYTKEGMSAWQACFRKHSTWLMDWVNEIKTLTLQTEGCHLEKIPVEVSRYPADWWLWWVPHPHIGGKPYTFFSITVRVNIRECVVV